MRILFWTCMRLAEAQVPCREGQIDKVVYEECWAQEMKVSDSLSRTSLCHLPRQPKREETKSVPFHVAFSVSVEDRHRTLIRTLRVFEQSCNVYDGHVISEQLHLLWLRFSS